MKEAYVDLECSVVYEQVLSRGGCLSHWSRNLVHFVGNSVHLHHSKMHSLILAVRSHWTGTRPQVDCKAGMKGHDLSIVLK